MEGQGTMPGCPGGFAVGRWPVRIAPCKRGDLLRRRHLALAFVSTRTMHGKDSGARGD